VLDHFDPDEGGDFETLFGLPHSRAEAAAVVIPVPWEATVSYGTGTANGPQRVFEESVQIDLADTETGSPWRAGLVMEEISPEVVGWNQRACAAAEANDIAAVNALGTQLNGWVEQRIGRVFDEDKLPVLLGGEHSVSYGAILEASRRVSGLSLLHVDAHADLRNAYQGYQWSHASVMHNLLRDSAVANLVQVATRDVGAAECDAADQDERVRWFTDLTIGQRLHRGDTWAAMTEEIVGQLGNDVWVSFDVDGLDPSLCPATGTPVPGGLRWRETLTLLATLGASGKRIVGFDIVEVGDAAWDANVASRLLYKLFGWAMRGRGGQDG
jgi:agmatinase